MWESEHTRLTFILIYLKILPIVHVLTLLFFVSLKYCTASTLPNHIDIPYFAVFIIIVIKS